jgi:hypothetical protein
MLKTDLNELQIGDWCFRNKSEDDNLYIALRFLEGDRGLAILPISIQPDHYNIHGAHCWHWNGSEDSPTISPSILHWGDGKDRPASWHGFLQDGKLITA